MKVLCCKGLQKSGIFAAFFKKAMVETPEMSSFLNTHYNTINKEGE